MPWRVLHDELAKAISAWMFTMYDEKFSFNTHVGINEKYMYAISIRCVKD